MVLSVAEGHHGRPIFYESLHGGVKKQLHTCAAAAAATTLGAPDPAAAMAAVAITDSSATAEFSAATGFPNFGNCSTHYQSPGGVMPHQAASLWEGSDRSPSYEFVQKGISLKPPQGHPCGGFSSCKLLMQQLQSPPPDTVPSHASVNGSCPPVSYRLGDHNDGTLAVLPAKGATLSGLFDDGPTHSPAATAAAAAAAAAKSASVLTMNSSSYIVSQSAVDAADAEVPPRGSLASHPPHFQGPITEPCGTPLGCWVTDGRLSSALVKPVEVLPCDSVSASCISRSSRSRNTHGSSSASLLAASGCGKLLSRSLSGANGTSRDLFSSACSASRTNTARSSGGLSGVWTTHALGELSCSSFSDCRGSASLLDRLRVRQRIARAFGIFPHSRYRDRRLGQVH